MSKKPLSLLVIDDEPLCLASIMRQLRGTGWNIKCVSDLKEGLELERNALPDVIVCDAQMPYLTGPQLIAMLKADAVTANIPVILMTGIADSVMFLHVPWTSFLQKPFTQKELIAAIKGAASTRHAPKPVAAASPC